jgi:predicted flap endonuclease-1-like 5' DNA nuclease
MTKLIKIEGIGEIYASKLEQVGVPTIEALLEKGSTPAGRQELVTKTDISATLILEWVNRADLVRVKGIGEEYADLLEAAGVDTVPELAQRNAQNLYQKLGQVNAEKRLVRRMPALSQVGDWISQAKNLPRKVTY